MKGFSFASLRVRLLFSVLMAILPLFGLTLYSSLEDYRHSRTQAFQEALNLARNFSQIQDRTVNDARKLLVTISHMLQIYKLDLSASSAILNELSKKQTIHTAFLLAKPDGEVIASSPPLTNPLNIYNRSYYQRLIQTGQFVIGEYRLGNITGKAIVPLAYPIKDEAGQLQAILITGLDIERFNVDLSKTTFPKGASLNVIDSNGAILFRYPDQAGFVGTAMSESSLASNILAREEGVGEMSGLDGEPHLYGFSSFGQPYGKIHVSVDIPNSIAFSGTHRKVFRNFILVAALTLLALAAAGLSGEVSIIKSVNNLLRITKLIQTGDFTARVGEHQGRGELDQLARSFDQMAEAIEKREADRNLAENDLRESEERYRSLFEQSRDAIYIVAQNGTIIDVNQTACDIYGYGKDELIGQHVNIVYDDPLDRPKMLHEIKKNGFVKDYEIQGRKKDGTIIDCLLTTTLKRAGDGSIVGNQGIVRDITERKRTEKALRESEERYRTIVENAHDIIWTRNKQGCLTFINKRMEEITGHQASEMLGRRFASLIHPEDLPLAKETFEETLKGKSQSYQIRFTGRDDRDIYLSINSAPLYEMGEITGTVGFGRDVTEQKKAEAALEHTTSELSALYCISRVASKTLDMEAVLKDSIVKAIEVLGVEAVGIYMLEPDGETITLRAQVGLTEGLVPHHTVRKLKTSLAGQVIEHRKVMVMDLNDYPSDWPTTPSLLKEGFQTLASVPLISKDHVLGALNVGSRQSHLFSPEALNFLASIGQILGGALENAQLYQETCDSRDMVKNMLAKMEETARQLQNKSSHLAVVNELDRVISSSFNLEEVYETFVRVANRLVSFDRTAIVLLEESGEYFQILAQWFKGAFRFRAGERRLVKGTAVEIIATTLKPFMEKELGEQGEFTEHEVLRKDGLRSRLLLPIMKKNRLTGLLTFGSCQSGTYNEHNLDVLIPLTEQLAIAIENNLLYKKVQASEEKYRTLLENSTEMIWVLDNEARYTYLNRQAEIVTGFKAEKFMGKSYFEGLTKEDLPHIQRVVAEALEGKPQSYQTHVYKPDGELFYLSANVAPIYNDGRIEGIISFGRDMTAEKKAQEALRESEEKYRALFEQSWDAIYINSSEDGAMLDCNQSFLDLFGYSRAELDQMGLDPLYVNPEKRPGLIQEIRDKGFIKDREVKCRRKDGTEMDLLITVNVRRDREGRIVGHQGVARDITERKIAEERILRESARTEALVHVAARINSQLDLQQVMKAICQETAQALKVSAAKVSLYDEAKDMLLHVANYGIPPELWNYLKSVPKKQYEGFIDKYGSTCVIPDIQSAQDIFQTEFHTRANTRTEAFLAIERNGKLIGGLTVMTFDAVRHFDNDDLTLLKGLADQAALAISNAQLFEQVSAGCKQLQILSGRLVEVQETERRQIACELHDEIGQSLTGLKLFIESSMRLPGDRARSCLIEAQKLISELMGQVEEMALNLRPSMLDDLGIIPTLIWHFQRYTRQTNVYVNFKHQNLHERRFKPEVETAAYRIVQESLTNVARHASVGEVVVRLGTDKNMLVVEIEDHGRGFAPHLVSNSCGLSGMRERAMFLGGFLTIESSPGAGAYLVARLPLEEPQVPEG